MQRRPVLLSFFFLLATASLILNFSSCTSSGHPEQVSKVDSLQDRLSKLKERLGKIDTTRTIRLQKRIEEQLGIFKEYFEKDSMGEDLYKALDDHRRTRKALKGYKGMLDQVKSGLERSEKQLKALKKDLKKGRHSKKEAKGYIRDEKKILEQLGRSVDELKKRGKSAFKNYESYSGVLREHLSLPDSVAWPALGKQ